MGAWGRGGMVDWRHGAMEKEEGGNGSKASRSFTRISHTPSLTRNASHAHPPTHPSHAHALSLTLLAPLLHTPLTHCTFTTGNNYFTVSAPPSHTPPSPAPPSLTRPYLSHPSLTRLSALLGSPGRGTCSGRQPARGAPSSIPPSCPLPRHPCHAMPVQGEGGEREEMVQDAGFIVHKATTVFCPSTTARQI
ncbi:unnamed protein product [Closterium sp. NIES-53]